MPKIAKQTTTPQPRPKSNDSVLSRAVRSEDLENDYIKAVIYGRNRVGKTTLGCLFPKPLLLISFEPDIDESEGREKKVKGAASIKGTKGVTCVSVKTTVDALKLIDELKGGDFKTHVLDTATSLQDIALQEIIGKPVPAQLNFAEITRDQYRDRSSKTKEILRAFFNLQAHTICLAQEKDHNPDKNENNKLLRVLRSDTGSQYIGTNLGGAAADWLHDVCDNIIRYFFLKEVKRWDETVTAGGKSKVIQKEEETGRTVRGLWLKGTDNVAAGIRSPNPKAVPDYVEGDSPEELYAALMRVIRGEKS